MTSQLLFSLPRRSNIFFARPTRVLSVLSNSFNAIGKFDNDTQGTATAGKFKTKKWLPIASPPSHYADTFENKSHNTKEYAEFSYRELQKLAKDIGITSNLKVSSVDLISVIENTKKTLPTSVWQSCIESVKKSKVEKDSISSLEELSFFELTQLGKTLGVHSRQSKTTLLHTIKSILGLSKSSKSTVVDHSTSSDSDPSISSSSSVQSQKLFNAISGSSMGGFTTHPVKTVDFLPAIRAFRNNLRNRTAASSFYSRLNGDSYSMDAAEEIFEHFKSPVEKLPRNLVMKILKDAIAQHTSLPNVIEVKRRKNATTGHLSALTVVGDTHGQFIDAAQIFSSRMAGFPSEDNVFVFNGDMVDRGPQGFEIVISLLLMKLAKPSAVHILRGNHETNAMNERYGFMKEIEAKYDRKVFDKFNELFCSLPIGAVLEDQVFVCHGGLGPHSYKMTINDMNKEINRKTEPIEDGPLNELLWTGK